MGTQPEAATYDSTVYSWETTDAVKGGTGGIANAPLLNLANRTGWLKAQVASILSAIASLAGLNSPTFTGSPRCPTAAIGDNSTLIADTAFVQGAVNGLGVQAITSGTVTLVQSVYGCAIIHLTGATTAACTVVFPAISGFWTVLDDTTGGYPVTLKTASVAGFLTRPGILMDVMCDGAKLHTTAERRLLGAVTLYVDAANGSDSNSGLASGTAALATIQAAVNSLMNSYDGAGQAATISVASGTYAAVSIADAPTGFSGLTVIGAGAATSVAQFACSNCGLVTLANMTLQSSSNANSIVASSNATVNFYGISFGSVGSGVHIQAFSGGVVTATGAYTINGGGYGHIYNTGGYVTVLGDTVTINNTPAFSGAFFVGITGGYSGWYSNTVNGSCTGVRWNISQNAVLGTNGSSATSLPGSTAGVTSSGGVVV